MIVQRIKQCRQPAFFPPTVERNGNVLTITNPASNGDYATNVAYVFNGETRGNRPCKSGETAKSFIEPAANETEQLYQVVVKVCGNEMFLSGVTDIGKVGFLEEPVISIEEGKLIIVNQSNNNTAFDVYVNGNYVKTVTDTKIALSDLLESTIGLYRFKVRAKNENDNRWITSSASNEGKYGEAPALSLARVLAVGGSVGDYAVIAGGYSDRSHTKNSKIVDAYDENIIQINPASLPVAYSAGMAAANVANCLLIAGSNETITVYDENLTQLSSLTGTSARTYPMSGYVGDYAVFAGGKKLTNILSTVDAYDENLTRTTLDELSVARYGGGSATTGKYLVTGKHLVIAGGYSANSPDEDATVDAYDENLIHTTPTALDEGLGYLAGARLGNCAVFAGGGTSTGITNKAIAYDENLSRITDIAGLSGAAHYHCASVTLEDRAVFAGGNTAGGVSNSLDVYLDGFIKTTEILSVGRAYIAAAVVGKCALFAGGEANPVYNTVEIFWLD